MTVKLTEQEKNTIVSVMNMVERRAQKFYKEYEQAKSENNDVRAEYNLRLYSNACNEIRGMRNLLRALGVVICYDWPGHRGEWFFPTHEEIDYYCDYQQDLREDG